MSIHVSYDQDEGSSPTESSPAAESKQWQQSSTDENIEGTSKLAEPVDTSTREQEISADKADVTGKEEKGTEQQEPSVDLSKQTPAKPHAEDTEMPVSSEVLAGSVVETTQEEQLPASDIQEEKDLLQTEDQPTEDVPTGASEDEEKLLPTTEIPPTVVASENQVED